MNTVFATKAALALTIVDRAMAAGIRPAWITADEVYGNDSKFRSEPRRPDLASRRAAVPSDSVPDQYR